MCKTRYGASPVASLVLGTVDPNRITAHHLGGCFVDAVDAEHSGKNEFGEKTVPMGGSWGEYDDEEVAFRDPLRTYVDTEDLPNIDPALFMARGH